MTEVMENDWLAVMGTDNGKVVRTELTALTARTYVPSTSDRGAERMEGEGHGEVKGGVGGGGVGSDGPREKRHPWYPHT